MIPIKSKPLFLQVEEYLQEKIASGVYPAHGKLPSARELSDITGTSYCTVQTALAKLCREGLLETRIGRGTYVIGDKSKLSCAGLYFRRPLSKVDSAFYNVLSQELRRKLAEAGIKVRVWSDEREEEEFPGPPDSLARAMEKREIQGLIGPLVSGPDHEWLKKTPVPSAVLTTDLALKNGMRTNSREMLKLGLEDLRRQGCRSVGTITSMLLRAEPSGSSAAEYYRSFVELSSELGLRVKDDWIRFPSQFMPHFSRLGHEQFHALWDLPKRPDGLLVFPDEVATGVVTAILERRVDVPEDLKVALHLNDLIPYVCPFEATFLCTDVGGMASSLIQMIQSQLDGNKPEAVEIPVSVRHNSPPIRRAAVR